MPPRPRIVLITGAPGSGKSTLGTTLANELRVPFLARDDVRGGLFLTAGGWSGTPERVPSAHEAVDVFLQLLEAAATRGVSAVAEYVVRRSRPDDLRRMMEAADCRVIVATATHPFERLAGREAADRLLNRPGVLTALGHDDLEAHTAHTRERMDAVVADLRTDFPVPVLEVSTDGGYQPGLDQIVEFAVAGAAR